jgi:hypothetical protein
MEAAQSLAVFVCQSLRAPCINHGAYVVPRANAFPPAATWYIHLYLCFIFALCKHKDETQKEDEVPLRTIT